MWLIYRALLGASLLVAAPWLFLSRGRHYLPTLRGRLAMTLGPRSGGPRPLWLHAVSVGEVGVAATLIEHLPPTLPLLVTTVTPTGQQAARRLLGGRAEIAYLPFDLAGPVRRFLRHFDPAALILVEGDYWPWILESMRRRQRPIAVVNGKIGDRTLRRLQRLGRWPQRLFGGISVFGAQTERDAERFAILGVAPERVRMTGNIKFDTSDPEPLPTLEAMLKQRAAGRPVLIAGSTMDGEEELVLEAFERSGGGADSMLVLAPRHPERWDRVAERAARTFRCERRSTWNATEVSAAVPPDIVILDSLGELAALYRAADAAFIGGTLVHTGGHNPIEPARVGTPILAGPSMFNFRAIASQFDRSEAWQRVADGGALGAAWADWIEHPAARRATGERGQGLVAASSGAAQRNVAWLAALLAEVEAKEGR